MADKHQDLGYCLTAAKVEVEKSILYLRQCLKLTGSFDKTVNQLIAAENLAGYSVIADMVVLITIKEDLESLLDNI